MKLSESLGRPEGMPADAAASSVAKALAAEHHAARGNPWFRVYSTCNARREWMWALVYFLEWVRRGR